MKQEKKIKFERVWAMPSKWTFTIKPIKKFLQEEVSGSFWIDPFAGENGALYADYTNDIEKGGMDALAECYGFNDKRIYHWDVTKVDVPRGREYIEFEIQPYQLSTMSALAKGGRSA